MRILTKDRLGRFDQFTGHLVLSIITNRHDTVSIRIIDPDTINASGPSLPREWVGSELVKYKFF